MGIYDNITDELFCPFCGSKNKDFQTKDTGQGMNNWTIKEIETYFERKDIIKIYNICGKCDKFISINIRGTSKDELQKLIVKKLKKIKDNGK